MIAGRGHGRGVHWGAGRMAGERARSPGRVAGVAGERSGGLRGEEAGVAGERRRGRRGEEAGVAGERSGGLRGEERGRRGEERGRRGEEQGSPGSRPPPAAARVHTPPLDPAAAAAGAHIPSAVRTPWRIRVQMPRLVSQVLHFVGVFTRSDLHPMWAQIPNNLGILPDIGIFGFWVGI